MGSITNIALTGVKRDFVEKGWVKNTPLQWSRTKQIIKYECLKK